MGLRNSGQGDDLLVGDADGNRLIRPDRVSTRPRRLGGLDRALLVDRETDGVECNGAETYIAGGPLGRT